ncbi:MAG: hypothetical protein ACLFSZ_00510 [Puniceicoccaceae bacterium]
MKTPGAGEPLLRITPLDDVTPLPDDFIPPDGLARPPVEPQGKGAFSAFLQGGIWSLLIFGALAWINLSFGGEVRISGGAALLLSLFVVGGIVGLVMPSIYQKGRKDASKNRGG